MEGYIGGTALPTNVTLGNCIPSMSYLLKRVTNINGQTCMSNRDSLRHRSKPISNQHHTTNRQDLPVPKPRNHKPKVVWHSIHNCIVIATHPTISKYLQWDLNT